MEILLHEGVVVDQNLSVNFDWIKLALVEPSIGGCLQVVTDGGLPGAVLAVEDAYTFQGRYRDDGCRGIAGNVAQ
ncbi:hypothetical protein D3C77_764650 [compost metagenome]